MKEKGISSIIGVECWPLLHCTILVSSVPSIGNLEKSCKMPCSPMITSSHHPLGTPDRDHCSRSNYFENPNHLLHMTCELPFFNFFLPLLSSFNGPIHLEMWGRNRGLCTPRGGILSRNSRLGLDALLTYTSFPIAQFPRDIRPHQFRGFLAPHVFKTSLGLSSQKLSQKPKCQSGQNPLFQGPHQNSQIHSL